MMERALMFDDNCGFSVIAYRGEGKPQARITKLEGWWGGAGVETDFVERIRDGAFRAPLRRTPRKLVIGVSEYFRSEAEVVNRAREVSGIFQSGEEGDGFVHVDYAESEKITAFKVALNDAPRVAQYLGAKMLTYELPLIVPDPYLYGVTQRSGTTTPGSGIGLQYPLYHQAPSPHLNYGDAIPSQHALVFNYGNAVAWPTVYIRGSFPSGFRVELAGDVPPGTGCEFHGPLVASQEAILDMALGRIMVDGTDQSFLLASRQWGGVAKNGQASARVFPLSQGVGSADLVIRSTYI